MARNSLGITEISTVSITPPGLWYSRDDLGARGLIRFGAALLPIAQRADRDVETRCELLLAQAQGPANDLRARRALHPVHIFFGERSRIGIAHGRGMLLRLAHCVEAAPVVLGRCGLLTGSLHGTCAAHGAL